MTSIPHRAWSDADERAYLARPEVTAATRKTEPEPECLADWVKQSREKEAALQETARMKRLGMRYAAMQRVLKAHREKTGKIPIEIYIQAQNFMVMCEVLAELQDLNLKMDAFFVEEETQETRVDMEVGK